MKDFDLKKKRVLVIDDQRPFLVMVKGMLNSLGARDVVTMQSCEAAIGKLSRQTFDLLLVDYDLGTARKNGHQFLEELKLKKLLKPESIFVLVSGETNRPRVLSAIEQQPDDYLIKPFSQAGLQLRLSKLFSKKRQLLPIYRAIYKEDWLMAIDECRKVISGENRHKHFCSTILVELLWKQGHFGEAKELLLPMQEKNIPWASMALAKNHYYQAEFEKAIEIAQRIVKKFKLFVEARDIIAQSLLAQKKPSEAQEHIKLALDMSPYSIDRQMIACRIGQINEDFAFVKECCFQIMELSKKSIHYHVNNYCNYVRSILDAAENSQDEKEAHNLQQEALLALQRVSKEDLRFEDFDFTHFEELINARIDVGNGSMLQAKRSVYKIQSDLYNNPAKQEYVGLDSLQVMASIGEVEPAKKMIEDFKGNMPMEDGFSKRMFRDLNKQVAAQSTSLLEQNKSGIECYNKKDYKQAIVHFQKALEMAPMNSGAALNLIQAIFKQLEYFPKGDRDLIFLIKKTFKLVDDIELTKSQHYRYLSLKEEFEELNAS